MGQNVNSPSKWGYNQTKNKSGYQWFRSLAYFVTESLIVI